VTRRLVTSHDGKSKDGLRYLVAFNGINEPIVRALVAKDGVLEQYWPPLANVDPNIEWDSTQLQVTNFTTLAGQPSIARIDFIDAGTYTYSDDPDDATDITAGPFNWLGIAVTAIEQYIIRADFFDGGDNWLGDDPFDTWVDAFGGVIFGVQETVQGDQPLTLDIHVAAVDPGQLPTLSPLAGSDVIKRVLFSAIVTEANDIAWSNDPWTVQRDTIAADALCVLTLKNDGTASAVGDNIETGDWHVDAPSPANPETFNVTTTLFSGDAPTGDPLGVSLDLGTTRAWTLTSALGDGIKTCVLDVAVDDGVDTVIRRVTMTSERVEGLPNKVVWTDTDRSINALSPPLSTDDAVATLTMNLSGTGVGAVTPFGVGFSEDWHEDAPAAGNPDDNEVKLVVVSGDSPTTGTVGVFLNLGSTQTWTLEADGLQVVFKQGFWDVTVRQVGNAASAVTKRIVVQAVSETGQ